MNKKLEEILSTSKLNELIRKSEKEEEKKDRKSTRLNSSH